MTEFERSVPQFRGGSISGENIDKNSFIELFADVFDTLLYQKLQAQSSSKSIDRAYTDNQTFWNDALKGLHFQSMHLQLQGFHLTEWIPSAPGRYFTSDAEKSREEAQRYINPHFDEYLPVGKEYMVLGGVGSVRLKAKFINSKSTYFLGASSTGISHQGIPIALLEAEYRQVIETIKNQGGCFANLVGTLQILPTSMALIHYDRKVDAISNVV